MSLLRKARPLPAGSTVVVTGAASGLGRSLAMTYHRAGHRVVLLDRDGDGLDRLAASLGDRDVTEVVDLAAADVLPILQAVLRRGRDVELLVACAGLDGGATSVGEPGNVAGTARVLGVNTLGAIACIDAAVAHFRQRGGGRLAVIGSLAALRGLPGNGYAGYCASKAAVRAYIQALQAELVRNGEAGRISATLVLPGHFRSPMTDPGDRFVIPLERVTADVIRGVEQRARVHVASGPVWRVQAALLPLAPLRVIAGVRTGSA